jgi:glycosyltransferase involved in cell wall biosynthesis
MKKSPDISFLVPDMGAPILGPVVTMADALRERYEVEIVGPDVGRGICPMYKDAAEYKVVPAPRIYRYPEFFRDALRLKNAVRGRVVIAVKAFADTLPVALMAKWTRGAKALVYLDEWDGAWVHQWPLRRRTARAVLDAHHPMEAIYHPPVERLIRFADHVLSTSTALQKRFGGSVVPLGVDIEVFKPGAPDQREALKAELGLSGKRLVVFGGVVRPHKGIETVLESLSELDDDNEVGFLVVGPETECLKGLKADPQYRRLIYTVGAQPKKEMPRYLNLADVIVLPLQNTPFAQTQVPCKVFEAMAMAKPVVATAVSDLPTILNGVGCVVAPDDVGGLTEVLSGLLADPGRRQSLGRAARNKCMEHYSRESMRQQMSGILDSLLVEESH